MKKTYLAAAFSAFLASSALATVTFEYQVGWNPGVSSGTVGVLVVDTNGDGFTGVGLSDSSGIVGRDYNPGTFFGTDDLIIDSITASDLGGVFGFTGNVGSLAVTLAPTNGSVSVGDEIGLYWFDAPAGATAEAGQTYGFYRASTADPSSGATAPFEIPADGSTVNMFAFSSTFTGDAVNSDPDAAFIANNGVVIPEPSTGVLALFASALLLTRRRR